MTASLVHAVTAAAFLILAAGFLALVVGVIADKHRPTSTRSQEIS